MDQAHQVLLLPQLIRHIQRLRATQADKQREVQLQERRSILSMLRLLSTACLGEQQSEKRCAGMPCPVVPRVIDSRIA